MRSIELVITGDPIMHCAGCETRVTYALRQLPGIRDVRASAKTQHVCILLDHAGAVGEAEIREKLKTLGYEAQPIGDVR